jgi:hypothetical protein
MPKAVTDNLLYMLAPNVGIQIRSWGENAVLYHGASASTSEISAIMAISLELLADDPQGLEELTESICINNLSLDKSECLEHLTQGYQQLVSQGVVQKLST